MMPGGRVNERQMKMAMKRMGITQDEIADVEEVIIRTPTKEHVVRPAQVTAMTVQGQRVFQVMGEVQVRERSQSPDSEPAGVSIPEEDVELVASQAQVSPEEARKALEECKGEPAEAIVMLMGRRR